MFIVSDKPITNTQSYLDKDSAKVVEEGTVLKRNQYLMMVNLSPEDTTFETAQGSGVHTFGILSQNMKLIVSLAAIIMALFI